ncbi:MAG: alpha/beta hydrolase [Opitutia bacterium]|nr:alpha/beta fold hydrolase [Opitutales bacterium]PHX79086.1 MAG: alpha/beta hydrolase [Opitutae bacterium]
MTASGLSSAVQALYPFVPKDFAALSGRMSYVDYGPRDGRPVLLLHGNPSWSFLWRDLILKLAAQGRRVIAPDHVGMGLSARPDRFLRLADRIADVEALIAHLGLKEFDLGVHDWGGAIGFGVAGRRPDRVGKILVTNTGAFLADRIPARIALCRAPLIGRFIVQGLNGFAWPATWMSVEKPLSPAAKAGFLAPYGSAPVRRAVADFVADIPMEAEHPTRPVLAAVAASLGALKGKPMLLCWGLRDFCFDRTFLEGFAHRFPAARQLLFADAGHYVLEDAGEAALGPIGAFFGPA